MDKYLDNWTEYKNFYATDKYRDIWTVRCLWKLRTIFETSADYRLCIFNQINLRNFENSFQKQNGLIMDCVLKNFLKCLNVFKNKVLIQFWRIYKRAVNWQVYKRTFGRMDKTSSKLVLRKRKYAHVLYMLCALNKLLNYYFPKLK